jgi:hypothetical protein
MFRLILRNEKLLNIRNNKNQMYRWNPKIKVWNGRLTVKLIAELKLSIKVYNGKQNLLSKIWVERFLTICKASKDYPNRHSNVASIKSTQPQKCNVFENQILSIFEPWWPSGLSVQCSHKYKTTQKTICKFEPCRKPVSLWQKSRKPVSLWQKSP